MNLLMVTVGFAPVGGLEIYNRDVAAALVAQGHDLTVWSMLEHAEPLEGVTTRTYKPSSRAGMAIRFRMLRRGLAWRIQRHADEFDRILCMHTQLAPGVADGLRGSSTPYWIWTYGTDIWGPWSTALAAAIEGAEKVPTISAFTANLIRERAPKADVPIIFPTVDVSRFTLDTSPVEPTRDPAMLTVSRIDPHDAYKGQDMVIASIPAIEDALGRRVVYRIAGSGSGPARLREIAASHGVADRVVFLGRLDDQRLAREYRECDLFVMPSRMDPTPDGSFRGEGFGIVYIEAQATGRPVVVSKHGAAPETIQPDATGLVADPTLPDSIAAACSSILGRPDRGRSMGVAGRAWVSETFGPDRFRERLSDAFGGI